MMAESSSVAGGEGGYAGGSASIDLSPGTTTVAFDPILPPLRMPLAEDGDSNVPPSYVLAFEDEASWRRAWALSERKITEQCEAGARMGCSIRASRKCQVPWWKKVLGRGTDSLSQEEDERRRLECEELDMSACLASAQENCVQHARDVCEPVFCNMRVAPPSEAEAGPSSGESSQKFSGGKRRSSPAKGKGTAPPPLGNRGGSRGQQRNPTQLGPSVRAGGGWEGGLIKPAKDPKPRAEYEEQVSRMLAGGGWNGWKIAEEGKKDPQGGGETGGSDRGLTT